MSAKYLLPGVFALTLLASTNGFGRSEFILDGRSYDGRQATALEVPHCVATHRVGEIVLACNNNGTFGTGFSIGSSGDCFTGGQVKSCEYPKGSNAQYLFAGAFWIGAVVGRGDTLVSVGADGWSSRREMTPFKLPMVKRSIINPDDIELGAVSEEDFICYYTDSVTTGIDPDPMDGRHRPLHIEVKESSYAWSYAYAEDIILFDYEITNIGTNTLKDVYMGLYNDGDVCFDCDATNGYQDDITGFLLTNKREFENCVFTDTVNIAWLADNDGDFRAPQSVPHVTAMRVVRTPAESLDVSFNWWISSSGATDFGPREQSRKGRLEEKFRDFGTGGLGTPEGDRNKYYIMRNKEFDYDQARIATIGPDDTLWLYPNQDYVEDWAQGLDTRYLLSFGPFTIKPGQTLPLSFAYLAGADLHSVEGNLDNLPYNYDTYYTNLDFSDLGENSTWASWIYDNPGVDTDGDGYFGEFRLCPSDSTLDDEDSIWTITVVDTNWDKGDGIPDFRGAAPPPAPRFRLDPAYGSITVRFNGTITENTRDLFTKEKDFEGYRIYIGRDERASSYSLVTSYDIEDYNRYSWNEQRNIWELLDSPFSLRELRCLYADSCDDLSFHPLNYTRYHPLEHPDYPGERYYFEKQDFNSSELGLPGAIRRTYPEQPFPSSLVPDSARPDELTEDGLFKYYEYEYTIENLLPSVSYWVNVTAFDFGSASTGLQSLETSVTIGAKHAYPFASAESVESSDLKVVVYPNPYRLDDNYRGRGFEGRTESDRPDDRVRRIHFANLPARCTISIYTIDGDLVKQIEHDMDPADPNASHDYWDMITRNTQMVVSGLYYWTVESDNRQTQIGKLAIIM